MSKGFYMLEYDWESSIGYWVCLTSHALRRACDARLTEAGMTLRQWEVLACLSVNKGCSQAELAEQMGIEPPTLAGILRRMARDGWLEIRACDQDRRKNKLFPTEKALEIWPKLTEICHQVRAQAIEGLAPAEIQELRTLCEKIRKNLDDPDSFNFVAVIAANQNRSTAEVGVELTDPNGLTPQDEEDG